LWTLCFGDTQGDALAKDFRNFCLNKGPTVIVSKESYRNGIYGAYTPLSWTALPGESINKYDSTIFTYRLTDRVDGTTNEFVQCFDDPATSGRLMIDYDWVGPCFGNDAFCIIDYTQYFWDANADMQVGCAFADRVVSVMPYQRFEVYYLA